MANLNKPPNQWDNNLQQGNQQPYPQNPNPYNNQNQFNNYQNPYNPYPPNNMGYIPPQPKSPKIIYIILIAVIIFFAVIIVLMTTSIRAMFNGGDNQQKNNDNNNNIIATQATTEKPTEEITTEETTKQTTTTTTTTTTVPIPETVTVTVIVEVEKEVIKEVEVPVQNNYEIYSGAYYACVDTKSDPLNIRSTPSKNGKVIGSIPKGKYIDVYLTSESGWYYTSYGGVSGYVSASYITLILSGGFYGYDDGYDGYYDNYYDDYDYGHYGEWATIATKSDPLNLRSSPSTSASIITSIPKGSSVYVNYEYDGTWSYITWGNYSGYVATQYLAF